MASIFFAFSEGINESKSLPTGTFYFDTRAQLVAQIDIKTNEIPFRILRGERRVGGIGTDTNALRKRGKTLEALLIPMIKEGGIVFFIQYP